MMTQTHKTEHGVVKNLRKIRDEINNEIKDMTFEQERAYLDKLLADNDNSGLDNPLGIMVDSSTKDQQQVQ